MTNFDKAVKYDQGKSEYHLLPSLATEEVEGYDVWSRKVRSLQLDGRVWDQMEQVF